MLYHCSVQSVQQPDVSMKHFHHAVAELTDATAQLWVLLCVHVWMILCVQMWVLSCVHVWVLSCVQVWILPFVQVWGAVVCSGVDSAMCAGVGSVMCAGVDANLATSALNFPLMPFFHVYSCPCSYAVIVIM